MKSAAIAGTFSAVLVIALLSPGAEGSGSVAPDGWVVSVVGASPALYPRTRRWLEVSTLAGTGRRRLTPRPAKGEKRLDEAPAVSPNGKTVAFAREAPSGTSLWTIGLDGSNQRVLVRPSQLRTLFGPRLLLDELVWSPDGSKLMAVVESGAPGCQSRGLIAVTSDSPSVRVLVRLKPQTYATLLLAGWSPDGTKIAYVTKYNDGECLTTHEGSNVISVANADGSHQRGLIKTGVTADVLWSPDGTQLAYESNCDEICNLFLIAPDGSHRRHVTDFTDPNRTGIDTYVEFPFAWWQGRILYGHRLRLLTFDSNTDKTSKLRRLPCPRFGRCKDWTDPPGLSLDALSSGTAVFDVFSGAEADYFALEAAPLPNGPVTRLPAPRPLRRSDGLDYYVVALTG